MFDKILTFLKSAKLTITQYLMLTLGAIIAILAGLLQLKSAQLKKEKLKALKQTFQTQQDTSDKAISDADEKLNESLRRLREEDPSFKS